MSPRRFAAACSLVLALIGCGARTGLLVDGSAPEAPADVAPDASPDADEGDRRPLDCVPGRFPLVRRGVEVVFVVDRSGSMSRDLDGGDGRPRRWDVLRGALAATVPRYEGALSMGAFAFPRRFDGNLSRSCQIAGAVDVDPAPRNGAAVLELLDTTEPWGATPTFDALRFTGERLVARTTRARAGVMVLATDGGPNCNPALDPATCACTALDPAGHPSCFGMPTNCVDDERASTLLADLATRGVPTFVIGLDGDALTTERAALDRLARAGGRPNVRAGEPAYYSARRAENLTAAFDAVQRSIATCTLVTPSRPDDPERMQVTLAGAPVPRDPAHADEWDWADRAYGRISFFGGACARVAASVQLPEVVVACGPGG